MKVGRIKFGPLYADRDPSKLEPWYSQHVNAMTAEGLHNKSDIAAELAHRDRQIRELSDTITDLQKERERLREQLDEYSDVLRGLASYVGCGGYNSYGRIAPKVAGEKIQWGIDHLLETLETELAELKQEVARLRSELDRYRNGRS